MRSLWQPALVLLLICFRLCLCLEDSFDYSSVLSDRRTEGLTFWDLPGFTRSRCASDHALITPESRVHLPVNGWTNATAAHLVSRALGAHFSMLLVDAKPSAVIAAPAAGVERFIFVLDGTFEVTGLSMAPAVLHADDFAYAPAGTKHSLVSTLGGGLLFFERVYALEAKPNPQIGTTSKQPLVPVAPEIFDLRKLLPQTADYDFNVHIMDFQPGEYLYVKEIHYNQHGLLLLQGQGIYRLADSWYPVQAGDAIWMAPYVLQWYGALGTQTSRYILYKDVTLDPLIET